MVISPKLRTASSVMAWLSLAGAAHIAIGAPLSVLSPGTVFAFKGMNLTFLYATATGLQITTATPFLYRLACMAVVAIPAGLQVWVLVELFRLLRRYARGQVFEMAALSILNRVASLLFWIVLAKAAAESAVTFILGRAVRQWWLGLAFSTEEYGFLFMAGIFLVIARVMAEAHRLADENAKFV